MQIHWQLSSLSTLSGRSVFEALKLRQQVFVLEQTCLYPDIDALDLRAHHLLGWSGEVLAAYLRILPPSAVYAEPAIGRAVVEERFRHLGLGRDLMERGIAETKKNYVGQSIRIGAQTYLTRFYESMGFVCDGASYDEDGIEHIEMVLVGD